MYEGSMMDDPCENEHDIPDVRNYDNVNHPKHYTSSKYGIECIQAIYACLDSYRDCPTYAWLVGQVIKYLWRAPLKGKFTEDIHKAQFYLNEIVKDLEK